MNNAFNKVDHLKALGEKLDTSPEGIAAAQRYRPPARAVENPFPPLGDEPPNDEPPTNRWGDDASDSDTPATHAPSTAPDPRAPPTMAPEGFPGLLGAVVKVACENSEAHPVGVAANLLAFFCAAVGRGPFQRIGDARIHCRPYAILVGRSGKARKGTSETTVREINRRAQDMVKARYPVYEHLKIHAGGLSSGEGLIHAICDEIEQDAKGNGGAPGVEDKRLLVIESEFANVLEQCKRAGNTLSVIVRNAFDGRTLEPLIKNAKERATNPHIVLMGHITGHELRDKTTATDEANGLLNRFMLLHVHRPKLVPLPLPTPDHVLEEMAQQLANAIDFATSGGNHLGEAQREVVLSAPARQLWAAKYPQITQDRDGRAGALMARTEVYARMLAMVFALLDHSMVIDVAHLESAFAWVDYWRRSAEFIFLQRESSDDPLTTDARRVLELVQAQPGIKLSAIQDQFGKRDSKRGNAALTLLLNLAPPLIEERRESTTGGRPSKHYYPCAHE